MISIPSILVQQPNRTFTVYFELAVIANCTSMSKITQK
jgi:hypothetical protein